MAVAPPPSHTDQVLPLRSLCVRARVPHAGGEVEHRRARDEADAAEAERLERLVEEQRLEVREGVR